MVLRGFELAKESKAVAIIHHSKEVGVYLFPTGYLGIDSLGLNNPSSEPLIQTPTQLVFPHVPVECVTVRHKGSACTVV